MKSVLRWSSSAIAVAGILAAAACSPSVPDQSEGYGPPPPAAAAPPAELAGAPPAQPAPPAAAAPPEVSYVGEAPPPGSTVMYTYAEGQGYIAGQGDYGPSQATGAAPPPVASSAPIPAPPAYVPPPPMPAPPPVYVQAAPPPPPPPAYVAPQTYPAGNVVAMAPIPNPTGPRVHHRIVAESGEPTVHHRRHHAQAMASATHAPVATKAAPVAAKPPPVVAKSPVVKAPVAKAPVVAAAKPPVMAKAPTKPVAPPSKLAQMQSAVGADLARTGALAVAPEVAQGKPGKVSLSLPANLFSSLRTQAGKFGFAKAAKKAEVSASLTGQGYAITPNGVQTIALKSGQAPRFEWEVTPAKGARGPLQARVDARLTGEKTPQFMTLASFQSTAAAVAAHVEKPKKKSLFDLSWLFGKKKATHAVATEATPPQQETAAPAPVTSKATSASKTPLLKDIPVPGIGKITGRAQLAIGLVLLAFILLVAVSRNMAAQRRAAERRRRFRTYTPMGSEPTSSEI